jgi:GNAT superfamily N-acetyltransferase
MTMEGLNALQTDVKTVKSLSLNIRPMQPADVSVAMRLSTAEGWNQTEKDWRLFIEDPANVCLLAEADGKVIGTTTAINYANEEAWIGMVLVDKEYRGLGVSKSLLSPIFNKLTSFQSIKLDATPAGQKVYQKFGFKDEYFIARMVNPSLNNPPVIDGDVSAEPIQAKHMDEIIAFDEAVFGVNRRPLIEFLINEHPAKSWLLKRDNRIVGFVLGRNGSRYNQIGPLVALTTMDAKLLLAKAMEPLRRQSIVVDVLYEKEELVAWLNELGFVQQRHFIRMYKEENPFPGATGKLHLICGPEFG